MVACMLCMNVRRTGGISHFCLANPIPVAEHDKRIDLVLHSNQMGKQLSKHDIPKNGLVETFSKAIERSLAEHDSHPVIVVEYVGTI